MKRGTQSHAQGTKRAKCAFMLIDSNTGPPHLLRRRYAGSTRLLPYVSEGGAEDTFSFPGWRELGLVGGCQAGRQAAALTTGNILNFYEDKEFNYDNTTLNN
jgi:hypothetical protein